MAVNLSRTLQELDDFLQFVLGLFLAGDVGEVSLLGAFVVVLLGAALAEAEGLAAAALHLAVHEEDEGADAVDEGSSELTNQGLTLRCPPRDAHVLVLAASCRSCGIAVGNLRGDSDHGLSERLASATVISALVEDLDRIDISLVQVLEEGGVRDGPASS